MSVEGPLQPEVQKTRAMGAEYRKKVTANKELVGRQREEKTAEKVKLTGEQAAREAELLALVESEDPTIAEFGKEQLAAFYADKPAEEPVVEEKMGLPKDAKERMIKESETEAQKRSRETEQVVDFVQLCEAYGGGWPTVQLREFGQYIDRALLDGKMTDLVLQQYIKNPEVLAPAIKKSIDAKIEEAIKQEVASRVVKVGLSDAKAREALMQKITQDAGSPEKKQAHLAALQELADKGEFKVDLSTPGAAAMAVREAMLAQGRLSAKEVVNIMATFETKVQDEIDDRTREEMWQLMSKNEGEMSQDEQKRKAYLNKMYKGSDGVQAQREFAASKAVAEKFKDAQRVLDVARDLPASVADILRRGADSGAYAIDGQLAYYEGDVGKKQVEMENVVEAGRKDAHEIKIWAAGDDREVVARGKYDAAAVINLRRVRDELQRIALELKTKPDFEQNKVFTDAEQQAGRLRDQVEYRLKEEAEKNPNYYSADYSYLKIPDKQVIMADKIVKSLHELQRAKNDKLYISSMAYEAKREVQKGFKDRINEVEKQRAELLKKVENELQQVTWVLQPTYYAKNWRDTAEKLHEAAKAKYKAEWDGRLMVMGKLETLKHSPKPMMEFFTGERKVALAALEADIAARTKEVEKAKAEETLAINNYEKLRQFMLQISEK